MSYNTPTDVEQLRPCKPVFLTTWSRSRHGEWLIERTYAEQYVRNVLKIPAGSGRVAEDGRYYIALPQGVHPSPLVRHPGAPAESGAFAIPLVQRAV